MKIHGNTLTAPQPTVVVIPRPEGELIFKAQAVLDYEDFEALCPRPNPPSKMLPGGIVQQNPEDAGYKQRLEEWGQKKVDWMILKSLSATESLEWDTVDLGDPETWVNYRSELAQTFSLPEQNAIVGAVMDACGLSQDKIEEATKRFLATQGHKQ